MAVVPPLQHTSCHEYGAYHSDISSTYFLFFQILRIIIMLTYHLSSSLLLNTVCSLIVLRIIYRVYFRVYPSVKSGGSTTGYTLTLYVCDLLLPLA